MMKIGLVYRKLKLLGMLMADMFYTMRYTANDKSTTEILILCHSLEKGMGINNTSSRPVFGRKKAKALLEFLEREDSDSYEYAEGISVLETYLDSQDADSEIDDMKKHIKYLSKGIYNCEAGVCRIKKEDMIQLKPVDYMRFIESRHSIRELEGKPVSSNDIKQAVKIALFSPSACNRQPWKFYCFSSKKDNMEISKLIMGNTGFEGRIPYYGIVTVSRSLFSWHEANQWFVNGGIFTANLVLAFHSMGIGSCIFQWSYSKKNEKKIRKIIKDIPPDEVIVNIVGFGYYPETVRYIKAQRRKVSDVLVMR